MEALRAEATLSVSPSEITVDETATLTAEVEPADSGVDAEPTGTVEFFADGDSLGTAALRSPADLTVGDLEPGEYEIVARYGGDDTFTPATSNTVRLTVTAAPEPSPTPQPTEPGPSEPGPSEQPEPTIEPGPAPPNAGSPGGELPMTGGLPIWLLATAGGLTAFGTLVVAASRRRSRTSRDIAS